jgi:hypothetical protein
MGTWVSFGTLESLEFDCKGQQTSHWGVIYIIRKLLKCRCPKWVRMTHLDIWNTSYGQKKRSGIKLTIWLPITESRESTQFPCVQVAWDMSLESSRRGLQLWFRPHPNRRFAPEVMVRKVVGLPGLMILELSFGSPGTKNQLDATPAEWCRVYYMGKVVASPESGPWCVLWVWRCSWFFLAPKVLHKVN